MGTVVESEAEIDRLMATTGDSVGLLLDTGHVVLAGADPARLARRYGPRINHVHCKDVRRYVLARIRAADKGNSKLAKGGVRAGAGRPLGARDKKPRKDKVAAAARARAAATEILLRTGHVPFEGDAHALLVWAYKNPDLPAALRLQAARDAAPYEKPRLNAISASIHTTLSLEDDPIDELLEEVNRRRQVLRNGEDNDPVRH
jgi:hypothetical protein